MGKIIIISLFLVVTSTVNAQTVFSNVKDQYDMLFEQCVKSCDEFMQRFNEKEYYPDLNKDDPNLGEYNFMYLFNSDMVKNVGKDTFLDSISNFYDTVKSHNIKLDYRSNKWFAEEIVCFTYKKKSVMLSLILQPEKTPKGLYGWTIRDVGGMGQIGFVDSISRMVISPEQNEAEFNELESCFKYNVKEFSKFRGYNIQLDALSYFFGLIESETLKFVSREYTRFHFYDVPGYIFTVDFFNRAKSNNGWLISDFRKMPEKEKNIYLHKL
ncbi:MAG: hypothetical protein LUC88_05315 [Prevotella sp.]|nr:hypothetical protein [Prevotella sp.]